MSELTPKERILQDATTRDFYIVNKLSDLYPYLSYPASSIDDRVFRNGSMRQSAGHFAFGSKVDDEGTK
jgi:hypothetical protein